MKLVIHDLSQELQERLLPAGSDIRIIPAKPEIKTCTGCFGCWLKTPARCVIKDEYQNMGQLLSRCDELVLISECFYGGLSPQVKSVLDRCIPYLHPYFSFRNGEMHHKRRYENRIKLSTCFYGANLTDREKETAKALTTANSINLDAEIKFIRFFGSSEEMKGAIL